MTLRQDLLGGAVPSLAILNGDQPAKPAIMMREVKADVPPPRTRFAVLIPSFNTWLADMSMAMTGLAANIASFAELAILNEKSSMITRARNNLVTRALDMNADAVLFVDSDLIFPSDAVARLMKSGKDIIGATYNKRVPPFETLGKLKGEPFDLALGGTHEADFMPGGFMLVRTHVFRRLSWPWFFERYRWPGGPKESFSAMMRDFFATVPPDDVVAGFEANEALQAWLAENEKHESQDRMTSEDYAFCAKARRAGFSIWCDLDLTFEMVHVGEQHVTCKKPAPVGEQMPQQGQAATPINAGFAPIAV